MVIFILAAVFSYLIFAPRLQRTSGQVPGQGTSGFLHWCRTAWTWSRDHDRGLATALVLFALVLTLYAFLAGPGEGKFFHHVQNAIRRIASAPETVNALLGLVAGMMCRAFPPWSTIIGSPKAEGSKKTHGAMDENPNSKTAERNKWPLLLFAGALSCVVLAALVAPHASTLLDRMSGVEVANFKVQFANSPTERQLIRKVERDLVSFDKLEDFPRSFRFIQYECGQAALEVGGMSKFKEQHRDAYENFRNALAFRTELLPYVNYIVDYQRKGYSIDILRHRVRSVAEKFERLLLDPSNLDDNYKAVRAEIEGQQAKFRDEKVESKLPPEERIRQERDPDPTWCDPPKDKKVNAKDLQKLIASTRYVHGAVSGFLNFVGDTEADIRIISMAKANLNKDININSGLAAALYLGERDFGEIFRLMNAKMDRVESLEKTAKDFVASPKSIEEEIQKKLRTRYDRVRFMDKVHRAYLWAQKGLDDVWPREEVPWWTALKYAEDAYKKLPDIGAARFPCIDDDWEFRINDTYAYVSLAFEAHNLQAHRIKPDQLRVRDARVILEDIRAKVLELQRDLKTPRSANDAGPCLVEAETKAWIKRISSHLRLAEALQR